MQNGNEFADYGMTGELKNFKKSPPKALGVTLYPVKEYDPTDGTCFICKCQDAHWILPAAPPDNKELRYHQNCLATFGV